MAQEVGLRRVLGFWSLLAAAVGIVVATTTLVALGQGMGIGAAGFILAMIGALLLNAFTAQSFGELACMMPRAGSISTYTQVSLGTVPAIISVICGYILVQIFAGPAELAIVGFVFNTCFVEWFPPIAISLIILFSLCFLNLIGVDVFARVQFVLTSIMIVSMSGLGIVGLLEIGKVVPAIEHPPSFNPMGWEVFTLVALAIWLFIGVEFVTPLAEETVEPEKKIPYAMLLALLIIFVAKGLWGFASLKYVPMDKLAGSIHPHIDAAEAILGKWGMWWIGIVSLCAASATMNTLICSISRILYGMAHNGEVPAFFKWLHPRFRTPWVGIFFMTIIMLIPLLLGIGGIEKIVVLILAACFSWLITYIIMHVNVIVLRFRYPDHPRPYKTWGYPIPQILGIAGYIYVLLNIFPDPAMKKEIYTYAIVFITLGAIYAFLWTIFKMKRHPFRPTSIETALKE